LKTVKRTFFFILFCLILGSLYLHLSHKQPSAYLYLPGASSLEVVEWKNPSLPLEKATLRTYEVFFSFKKETLHDFFWGDLIGIRYKTLELRCIYRWIGFKDYVEYEALCSDYLDLDLKSKYPTKTVPIKASSKKGIFSNLWKKLFNEGSSNFIIKRATLKIEYFPLNDKKSSYSLSCKDGKLLID